MVRGCPPEWVREIYNFAALPDLTFFFKANLEVSLQRILDGRPQLKYFEAGMDLRLSTDPYESFRIFQGRMLEQYLAMSTEFNFLVIDANQPIEAQQNVVRELIANSLDWRSSTARAFTPPHQPRTCRNERSPAEVQTRVAATHRRAAAGHAVFTATECPAWTCERLAGKLIVVEGRGWLGPLDADRAARRLARRRAATPRCRSGLKRSTLVSEELEQAQQGNILSRTTLSLFYATDFADQLENIILPALKAGFMVLADRYIYTLMARDLVRGMDETWLKNLTASRWCRTRCFT